MPVLPNDRLKQIEFCESHLTPWNTNAAAIGLTAPDVSNLATLTTAARTAYTAAVAARQASKTATLAFYDAVASMRDDASTLIKVIKTFADSEDNPNVYVLAQIPPPAAPSPAAPPGKPGDFTVILNTDGSVKLRFKSADSAGSTGGLMVVQRRSAGEPESAFAVIGSVSGAGGRRFTEFDDATLTAGAGQAGVVYRVVPSRGGVTGEASDSITVRFGSGGGPGVVSGALLKMAA
jgi:hypothetical protein